MPARRAANTLITTVHTAAIMNRGWILRSFEDLLSRVSEREPRNRNGCGDRNTASACDDVATVRGDAGEGRQGMRGHRASPVPGLQPAIAIAGENRNQLVNGRSRPV